MTAVSNTPSSTFSSHGVGRTRARRFVWSVAAIALALAAGGVGYGVASLQGSARVDELESELSEVRQEQGLLDASFRHRIGLLEARRHLHMVLDALDSRNFGTAQGLLDEVSMLLMEQAEGDETLSALSTDIANTQLVAASDFHGQRALVRRFTARLDDVLGPVGEFPSGLERRKTG